MEKYIGKRVIFTLGSNDAIMQAKVTMVSPNGKFVNMGGSWVTDNCCGWHEIERVSVKDVLVGDEASLFETLNM